MTDIAVDVATYLDFRPAILRLWIWGQPSFRPYLSIVQRFQSSISSSRGTVRDLRRGKLDELLTTIRMVRIGKVFEYKEKGLQKRMKVKNKKKEIMNESW